MFSLFLDTLWKYCRNKRTVFILWSLLCFMNSEKLRENKGNICFSACPKFWEAGLKKCFKIIGNQNGQTLERRILSGQGRQGYFSDPSPWVEKTVFKCFFTCPRFIDLLLWYNVYRCYFLRIINMERELLPHVSRSHLKWEGGAFPMSFLR